MSTVTRGKGKMKGKSNNKTRSDGPSKGRKRETRCWTDTENKLILEYLLNAKQKGFFKVFMIMAI